MSVIKSKDLEVGVVDGKITLQLVSNDFAHTWLIDRCKKVQAILNQHLDDIIVEIR